MVDIRLLGLVAAIIVYEVALRFHYSLFLNVFRLLLSLETCMESIHPERSRE